MITKSWWRIALLGVLAGCGGSGPHDGAIPDPEPITVTGMQNTARAGDLLFGGQPSQAALRALAAEGYKTILTTRGANELGWDEGALADSLGLRFMSIPMNKPVNAISEEQVAAFADLMQSGERPMVLHCSSGNRVAGLWAVWLAKHRGLSPDEALRLGEMAGMTRIRPVVEARLAPQGGK